METIGELFAKPIGRKIEEVIKVEQSAEEVVREEIQEYVVTDSIREYFRTVYQGYADSASEPTEGIGIWVSGFFGSGKSSFAKILGYTIANRKVGGAPASELFKRVARDGKVDALLDFINAKIPSEAVIFDVSMDRGVRSTERITEMMYKALLRELGYADDFDLAELEIGLEADGKLQAFENRFESMFSQPWQKRRKVGMALNEASAVLNALEPKVYPNADSWVRSIGKEGRADISANLLASRAFELMDRRRPGHALLFVVDEVGQWVSRSVDRMLDLMGVVQAFGVEGRNRVNARKAVAPAWIVVTSQEKLNEVVTALDSKKIELARLQDRFPWTIDLKQTDISEVTRRRVLEKSEPARKLLAGLYEEYSPRLRAYCTLERTNRETSVSKDDFVGLYPYLPYQVELSIDIVSGLRLRRGAHQHVGGSNRTIIKQAQQMMIHDRTRLADQPIGTLVTLDKIYELLYAGNLLPTELTREVETVRKHLPGNEMALRIVQAISLLEQVEHLPRTAHNIAVVLHPNLQADSLKPKVERALNDLEAAQFVREAEDGYKLLTQQEKTWEHQRNALEPKPADRNRIKRTIIKEIFDEPKIRAYRYKDFRPFRLALSLEGEPVEAEGQVQFNILTADGPEDMSQRKAEARAASNAHRDQVFWVADFGEELARQIEEFYRSEQMVENFAHLGSQKTVSKEEQACLADEKIRQDRIHQSLRKLAGQALAGGVGYFQGVEKDGSALGKSLPEVLAKLLDWAIPDLYPKLEMGVRRLTGEEPEKFLTATNLSGLLPVFYSDEGGLALVISQGGKFVPNVAAPVCKELLEYLRREHSYGNKVTGKLIERFFAGPPYAWELDMLRLVLAVLLRGGAIEVTHQGRRYRTHSEPSSRIPFTNHNAFRAASFAPREALDLKILADAARRYEELTGKDVDIEESSIAQAFRQLAAEDRERLLPLSARMQALKLPGADWVSEQLQYVEAIAGMPSDDSVKTLAGEGGSYKEIRRRVSRLMEATSEANLTLLTHGRRILDSLWPVLKAHGADESVSGQAEKLAAAIKSESFYDEIATIRASATALAERYAELYRTIHEKRWAVYTKSLDAVRALPEWDALATNQAIPKETREGLLSPLTARICADARLNDFSGACTACHASVSQMEAEIEAADAVRAQVSKRVLELAAPEERIERVRVASLLSGRLESEADIRAALEVLREHLLKLLATGAKVILE